MKIEALWHDLRWRVGLLVFAVLLSVGGACAAWALHTIHTSSVRAAQQDVHAMAQSVGQTLAQQLARAVRLGIALAELPGVPTYLEATLQRQPVLRSLVVELADGRALHRAGPEPTAQALRVPISTAADTAPAGFVVVDMQSMAVWQGGLAQPGWLAALTVWAVALACAVLAAWGPGARLEAQRRSIVAALQPGQGQALSTALPHSPDMGDGLQPVLELLAQQASAQRAAHEALHAYAQELLSMDFDGHMRARIERVLHQATHQEG